MLIRVVHAFPIRIELQSSFSNAHSLPTGSLFFLKIIIKKILIIKRMH